METNLGLFIKMIQIKRIIIICVFGLILIGLSPADGARQNPLKNPRICGRPQCEIENSKFSYSNTMRYKYDYTMHISSEFVGTGDNTSDLYMKAKIDFIFPRNCEGVLQIENVELSDKQTNTVKDDFDYYTDWTAQQQTDDENLHSKSSILANNLQQHELRFAFHDGIISEICPNENEPIWVVNFKKGILSAFQNTMLRFDVDLNTTETDVSGTCNVIYSLEGAKDTSVVIKKVKNIQTCKNRHQMHSVLQSTPYTFRDDKAIWPILNSQSYCNLTIDHNIYQEINCFERHQLIPFSQNETGAVTEVSVKFELSSEENYEKPDYFEYDDADIIKRRSTLLFDHTPTPKPTHNEIKASRELLRKMCHLGAPSIERDFIDIFTKFLQTTRILSYETLKEILSRSSSICPNGKNHVLESLPYIGSTASIRLMKDQLINNYVSKDMADSWMMSLSFIRRPDEETLDTLFALIKYGQESRDPEYTLGATAVVHTFCRYNSECEKNKKVKEIVEFLEDEFLKLLATKNFQRKTKERLIVILKGLGNIGVMNENFIINLKKMIWDETIPEEIHTYAVLAFRRTDCNKHKDFFLDVYQNFTVHSEPRIFSYIHAMRCPDYISVYKIKKVLETEEVNQVGSYVWSHLNNLAKSASPVRVEAQGLLTNNDLGTKYKMDIRRFSRNFEYSIFFDEYNFGTATDANLIFGADSYIPRFGTLNFTADLFGESINFFEISARAQGFEQLLASTFGPKGPLNADTFKKKFSFLNNVLSNDDSSEQDDDFINFEKLRLKRNADSDSESQDYNFEGSDELVLKQKDRGQRFSENAKDIIRNDVNRLGYKLKYNYNEPRAAFGLKVFGNDLKYITWEGMPEVLAAAQKFNPFVQAARLLSGKPLTFSKSGVFLDASYNVPLIAGLPLSIHAFGASSIDLRMSGNLNTRDQVPGKWNLDIESKLKPSVSVDVITSMEIDFFYANAGIRVKCNLYSSSSVESQLKIRGTELVSLTFSLPQDKNQIFSARSELIVIKESEEIPQAGIPRRYSNSTCTWPILDLAVGLKMCSSYSLPDVSNPSEVYPGLLLSGPIDIDVHLEKADPSAKTFVFEYRWDQVDNTSIGSFVFETPGSNIPRILTANITKIPQAMNMSVSFQNGNNTHSAVGRYSAEPDDRRLDIFLHSNGKSYLTFEMNMNRTQIKNGWAYYPRFLLTISNEKVAGLVGTVKVTEKKGIIQSEINVLLETKRLQSRVMGFITKTDVSYSTKLRMDYRFQENNIENIELEGELSNRGQKSKIEYRGNLKLLTTAYPTMNFVSNVTWLSLLGHHEGNLTYNNAGNFVDPDYTTTMRIILARSPTDETKSEGYRTKISFEVIRPISHIDYRILLKHEERHKTGPVHNILTAIRYSTKKEATAYFSIYFPKRNLFAVDGSMNITVPSFDSCTARLQLIEKNPKDYAIDFGGTWFSGHSVTIKGTYIDKSSRIKSHHQVKLMIKSPSFDDTIVNFVYRRNDIELLSDLQVEYGKLPYGVTVKYSSRDENQKNTYVEIKVKDKLYWLSAKLLTKEYKLLVVEVHLDKTRDIHLTIRGYTSPTKKEVLMEIKWDANRDPSQVLSLIADFSNPSYKKYNGILTFTYPYRTLSCSFDIYNGGPNYKGIATASWGPNDVIALNYNAGLIPGNTTNNWFHIDLKTPFEGWKENMIEGGIFSVENLILVNSSILWAENQSIALIFKGDYQIKDPELRCELKIGLNSSIQDVPTVSAHFIHQHDLKVFYTDAELRYNLVNESLQVYSVKSDWKFDRENLYRVVSGSIVGRTPFKGYKTGTLVTKFQLGDNKDISGGATLTFEEKKFTLTLEGYVKKLTNNMLQINITTPIERFRTINGRFGLNEKEKHAVAEIRAPAGAIGAEILFLVNSFSEFDVKLSLATPLEGFQSVIVIGKINPETVDLRGGWNNITVGFTGVWRLRNATDFEYSYRVFTPLESFRDNGIIVKFVKTDEFILEVFGKFATYKTGIKLYGKPKPKLITQLALKGLGLELLDDDLKQVQISNDLTDDEEEDDEDYEIDYEDLLNYNGYMELDLLIWPTVTGSVDIEEIRDNYIITGNIKLPQGKLDIQDRLYYPDMLNIKNMLKIYTPFQNIKQIKSNFEYSIMFKHHYISGLEISYLDRTEWTDIGYFVNYSIKSDVKDYKMHNALITLKTPFPHLKRIDLSGLYESGENIYRGNFTSKTVDTQLSLGGFLESDGNYLDASVGIVLKSPIVPYYACHSFFKKDFTEIENSINLGIEVHDEGTASKFQIETKWHVDGKAYINGNARIHTNIIPLRLVETSVLITKNPNPIASFDLSMTDLRSQRTSFYMRASRKNELVDVEILTPMRDFQNISLIGKLNRITPNDDNKYKFVGNLYKNSVNYGIDGDVLVINELPIAASLRLRPKSGGPDGVIEFSIKSTAGNYGSTFEWSAVEGGKRCHIAGGYSKRNNFDWDFQILVQSSEPEISRINLNAKLGPQSTGKLRGNFNLKTPWKHLGIEAVSLDSDLDISSTAGKVESKYELDSIKGKGICSWSWIVLENMQLAFESHTERSGAQPRIVQANVRYINPQKNFQNLIVGGMLDVDSKWLIAANGTIEYKSANNIIVGLVTKLPKPIGGTHHLTGIYNGNLLGNDPLDVAFEFKYENEETRKRFGTRGLYKNTNNLEGMGRIEWGPNSRRDAIEGNIQMLRKNKVRREFLARAATPYFQKEDSLVLNGSYDYKDSYHLLICGVNSPETKQIANADISYLSLSNMRGYINSTTPFKNITWLRGDFNFSTTNKNSLRYLKANWPQNSAFFKLFSTFNSNKLNRDLQGTIEMEAPLATKHAAVIDYSIKEKQLLTVGHANVNYNSKKILEGKYTCKSEQKAGFEKDVVDISLENSHLPVGIRYIHSKQYTDAEYPDYDFKHAEIYELRNNDSFNITGELHVRSTKTGQEYKIIAIHPNRTVVLTSEYDYNEMITKQKSKLHLAPTIWIGYNIEVENKTTIDNESQNFIVELSYPKRNLSTSGRYTLSDGIFNSDISFKWANASTPNEIKEIKAGFLWRNETLINDDRDNQTMILTLGHPSFSKDVTFKATYYRNPIELLKTKLLIDYSNNSQHLITFTTNIKDNSRKLKYRNYTLDIYGYHEISSLELDVQSSAGVPPAMYKIDANAYYKRGYFPEKRALFLVLIDLKNKSIDYLRDSPYKTVKLWAQPYGQYPVYGINGTIIDSPDVNSTGFFYIDFDHKYTRMEVNLTPDATQNIQMIGYIPDARSGSFDLWRNYEEIRVIDITSYLRMNHSRLITGQLHWRPKLKSDIKNKVRSIGTSFYDTFSDAIDFWIKTMYNEIVESVNEMWSNAKPETQGFLDDLSGLSILEEDLEDFRKFLNQSYEANDFYIKTMVNFTLTVLDELALRDHIESLPKIFREIWQVMGDSGKALRKSILWLIDTIKITYHKAIDIISKFLHGESFGHLSVLMEKAVEKYDKFVKDLHLSFIKYVEKLWNRFTNVISDYWKAALKRIEPYIFRFVHYIESAAWNISKEIFDFIYKRTNELAESPYFNQVSSFTQDLDRLYRDIKSNDAITNFKKYSKIAWNFVKEKYFKIVPFGKELHEILTELWESVKGLQKVDSINFIVQKYKELEAKIEWLAEELEVERRIHQLWALLRNKITRLTQTALQTDDMYREAKTKFIFDPDIGHVDLEQKLPMSWHAFNETPKFEEIPEYKFLVDVQNFFSGTNFTATSLIYTIRNNMDPNMWFPPYKSQSLLIGSRQYMTFDKKFVSLNLDYDDNKSAQCSYVLAHDFFNKNFTLLSEPSSIMKDGKKISTRKLTLITDKGVIQIDIAGDNLQIDQNKSPILPVQIGDAIISRDSDIITVESVDQGFTLSCNLLFDLCWFELSGWYFGQTAGILGTMNNEHFDDFTTSKGKIQPNEEQFIDSWALRNCKQQYKKHQPISPNSELYELCVEFFRTPYFASCFDVLDPDPFYEMCINMGANSVSSTIKNNHPAQKEACAAALGYIEGCSALKIPLRIPDKCVHCDLINGSYVTEGTFIEMKDNDIPRTSDVVFIVEAKPCNKNLTHKKNIMAVVTSIDNQLEELNITNNRFAVLTFGGRAPFDKSRSVVHNNKVFTNADNLKPYFDSIETHNGTNNDIFQAISVASKLIFRPGASKTFILLPCSGCASHDMKFDYSSLLQLMLEEGITLHILMDDGFVFDKARLSRKFFGMDRDYAYDKDDFDKLKGDVELRKQVRLPKEGLRSCTPLAIETNGSIFTSRKLRPEKKNPIKKFAVVFARRVAKTAIPNPCQTCECTGHNTGIAYMICTSCDVPNPITLDYEDIDDRINDFMDIDDDDNL